jgi:tetratricopeptide (TPR) repeat protein
MGRAFYRPTRESVPPAPVYYHKASDRYYVVTAREGQYFLSRHQIGYGGKETNRIEKRIDYVVGSGGHARTYLHRNADGQLVELPLSWYSEKGGYWAMSPGYDNPRQEDFRRAVPEDCLFCHNGYPRDTLAEGIDCQRCHGPGRAHIEAASSAKPKPEEIRAAIVNPARLDRDGQLDDCMQCHLETTSLRLPNAIRKYDRPPFSYRPGEPLTAYQQYFDHAPGTGFDDRFEVAHHAYRLRKSNCFLNSKMTCVTCHDPHRKREGAEGVAFFVGVCRSCHPQAHATQTMSGASTCLDCHMWKRRTEDAVHVVMTDHFIQRHKPARDFLASLEEKAPLYRHEVIPYYPARPESDLYLAVAQVQHESNLPAGIPRLKQEIEKNKLREPELFLELGKAEAKSGNQKQAIGWFEEALNQRNSFHPALRELAAALALAGEYARAVEVGERACAQQPPDTAALSNLANAYLRQGNPDRAQQVLDQALAISPDLPEACNLLGLVRLTKKDPNAAEAAFRAALASQPDMAEANNNLANLLAGKNNYPEAAYHFQKAIASDPQYADAHHSYGLLLALTGSFSLSMSELERASQLAPNASQLHVDFADALLDRGYTKRAADEYRRAIQLDPNNFEAHLAIGTLMMKSGNTMEGRAHLQKAAESSDPAIRNAALKAMH